MTKVEVKYEFSTPFEESWTQAIEQLHGVYGFQMVQLKGDLTGLNVQYDASRLRLEDVDHNLRAAGLPVRRN